MQMNPFRVRAGKVGLTSRGRLLFNPQDIGDFLSFPKADSANGI